MGYHPTGFLSLPHLPMHKNYTLDMGKVDTQSPESVLLSQTENTECSVVPPEAVAPLMRSPNVHRKTKIEYGSSLGRRKPIFEHDSSPLKLNVQA